MATYATLTEFRRDTEEFSAYLERVELYFAANEIAEEKQVPIFLNVVEYVAELRRLAARCAFGGYLKEALRDRIVCGLRSEPTQRKLLGEEALTLGRAVEVAVNMESAQKHALALKGSPSLAIGKVDHHEHRTDPPANGKPYYRCEKLGHRAADCPFRNASCHKCGKKGHLAQICRSSRKRPVQGGAARGRAKRG